MPGPADTPAAPPPCPQCGGDGSLSGEGVCLRCAGERALAGLDFTLPPPLELPGTLDDRPLERIGAYAIIEEIGRGGMGRVYAARQPGLGRIVALKALPEGRGGVAGLELRFLREAQTAARLRHPHIVTVHDSGRADGHVWFTMDYLEDGDLAHRLRQRPFTPRESATLLEKVARALAYTHGEGVLHRDLKPSNILLDGAEPRLADFGLAAQLEPGGDLTAASGVLGTPHYVAPEALRAGSAALTEASDLYALGVVLYELLTGRTPFAGASPAQLVQLVERDAPLPLRLLAPGVPRDLETICLKCLERDPDRRYPSAYELSQDLQRYLAGEPVLAQAPGTWTRFRRLARRHRVALTAAAAAALVLTTATLVSTSLAVRARRAEKAAASEAAAARAISDFLRQDLLAQASPSQQPDRDLKLRTVLDRASRQIEGRFTSQPLVEAELRATLAETYAALGEAKAGMVHLDRALALFTPALGTEHPRLVLLRAQQARALAAVGATAEATALAKQVLTLADRVFPGDDPRIVAVLLQLAAVHQASGDIATAESCAARALDLARRVHGPDHADTRQAMMDLSSVYWSARKLDLAEPLNTEAVAVQRRALGPEHPDTLLAMHNLASVYWSQGKMAEAEKLGLETLEARRRVLGPEHPETLRSQNNLVTTYQDQGRYPEAIKLAENTLEIRRRLLGPEHPDTLSSILNLAMIHSASGDTEQAGTLLVTVVAAAQRTLGPAHQLAYISTFNLADIRTRQNRLDEALTLFRQSYDGRLKALGPESISTLNAVDALATLLARQEKFEEAETMFRNSFAIRLKSAPQHWRTHVLRYRLGSLLLSRQRTAEAGPLLLEAANGLRAATNLPASARFFIADSASRVAEYYTASGQPAQAAEWQARVAAAK